MRTQAADRPASPLGSVPGTFHLTFISFLPTKTAQLILLRGAMPTTLCLSPGTSCQHAAGAPPARHPRQSAPPALRRQGYGQSQHRARLAEHTSQASGAREALYHHPHLLRPLHQPPQQSLLFKCKNTRFLFFWNT